MTEKEIDFFEKVQTQLEGMYEEISILSKKTQNDGLSLFKLKFINEIISDSNKVLGKKYKPFDDFELFDEISIPTNSDVVMILSQYLNCCEKFRIDNISVQGIHWFWNIDDASRKIKTKPPKKIR